MLSHRKSAFETVRSGRPPSHHGRHHLGRRHCGRHRFGCRHLGGRTGRGQRVPFRAARPGRPVRVADPGQFASARTRRPVQPHLPRAPGKAPPGRLDRRLQQGPRDRAARAGTSCRRSSGSAPCRSIKCESERDRWMSGYSALRRGASGAGARPEGAGRARRSPRARWLSAALSRPSGPGPCGGCRVGRHGRRSCGGAGPRPRRGAVRRGRRSGRASPRVRRPSNRP